MLENQNPSEMVDKVVGDIQKDFKIVGTSRVHSWYAWAIVGIVFGMALGIVYVANRSGEFASSQAAKLPAKTVKSLQAPTLANSRLVELVTDYQKSIAAGNKITEVTITDGILVQPGETVGIGWASARAITQPAESQLVNFLNNLYLNSTNPFKVELKTNLPSQLKNSVFELVVLPKKLNGSLANLALNGLGQQATTVERKCECSSSFDAWRVMCIVPGKSEADPVSVKPLTDANGNSAGLPEGTKTKYKDLGPSICTDQTDCSAHTKDCAALLKPNNDACVKAFGEGSEAIAQPRNPKKKGTDLIATYCNSGVIK